MEQPRDRSRVLVLDGDQGAALAIVRALGRRGIVVDVGERTPDFISRHSRFAREALVYPDPLVAPTAFIETIARRVADVRYDLVIPVAEDTVQPLARARASLEPHTRLAIAPTPALELMTDKHRTFALAESLGIPVPRSLTIERESDLDRVEAMFSPPIVLKPARSLGRGKESDHRVRLNVSYAHDSAELRSLTREMLKGGPVIAQEYFRGTGVGIDVLVDRGEIVYAFQHRRLHELPPTGGGSCLRDSVPVNPTLLGHAQALMRAVGWHGVAMVEMKLDEATQDCRLMEVNGRFWGSLPLAVAANADFPWMLFELLTRGARPPADLPAARVGVVARKLSADVYWYVQVLTPRKEEDLIQWPTKSQAFRDLLLAFSPRHRFDVQSLADPRPGIIDASRTGAWFLERAVAVTRQRWAREARTRERRRGVAIRQLSKARQILFVCHGNINRSAVAEHDLRRRLGERGRIVVRSAGFHPECGRPADPRMVRVAARAMLDLSAAQSTVLDPRLVESSDLIFAMENQHLERLFALYPSSRGRAFLLSSVTEDPHVPLEISDPYGLDEDAYRTCFLEVVSATRALARHLDAELSPAKRIELDARARERTEGGETVRPCVLKMPG